MNGNDAIFGITFPGDICTGRVPRVGTDGVCDCDLEIGGPRTNGRQHSIPSREDGCQNVFVCLQQRGGLRSRRVE